MVSRQFFWEPACLGQRLYSLSMPYKEFPTVNGLNSTHLLAHSSAAWKLCMVWLGPLPKVSQDWNQGASQLHSQQKL